MARIDNLVNFLTDIANAIRNKKGTSASIAASNFDTEIANIPSGDPELESNFVGAFDYYKVSQLTKLPEGITYLRASAFADYAQLKNLKELPSTLTQIGNYALRGTRLTSLDVKSTVLTTIGTNVFYNITTLKTIIFRATTPPSLTGSGNFTGTLIASGTGYIYVPDTAVATYKAATNWSKYADQIKGISELPV